MEECITRFPEYADFKRMEDGNTALHIAASNDKLEILKYLCSLVRLAWRYNTIHISLLIYNEKLDHIPSSYMVHMVKGRQHSAYTV